MKDIKNINAFLRGGLAIGTLANARTGVHSTYKFELAKQTGTVKRPPCYFVSVLMGPDNHPRSRDYHYVGMLFEGATELRMTAGSKASPDAPSVKGINWLLRQKLDLPEGVTFEHMGNCSACNRPLTNPESLAIGMGPYCRSKA